MKELTICFWSSEKGLYLYKKGSCFQLALLEELEKCKEFKNTDLSILRDEVTKLKEIEDFYLEDLIDKLIADNLTLDWEFASQLRLFDIIKPECFETKTLIGKGIIELFIRSGYEFIFYARSWETAHHLNLHFEVYNDDFSWTVYRHFLNGKFDYQS